MINNVNQYINTVRLNQWANYDFYFVGSCSSFVLSRMSQKNQIALVFIASGLMSAIALSLVLPEEKLILALSTPSALVGAGLSQWTSSNKDNE